MKTTRMDIEGPNGSATLVRDGRRIVITGKRLEKAVETSSGKACLVSRAFRLLADAVNPTNETVVADLQLYLDGYRGTNGDRADYRRAIDALAD